MIYRANCRTSKHAMQAHPQFITSSSTKIRVPSTTFISIYRSTPDDGLVRTHRTMHRGQMSASLSTVVYIHKLLFIKQYSPQLTLDFDAPPQPEESKWKLCDVCGHVANN